MITEGTLNAFTAALGLASSCYLCRGVLNSSAKTIADLASTSWDMNKDLAQSLIVQRSDYASGFVGLALSSIITMVFQLREFRQDVVQGPVDFYSLLGFIFVALCLLQVVRYFVKRTTGKKFERLVSENRAESSP